MTSYRIYLFNYNNELNGTNIDISDGLNVIISDASNNSSDDEINVLTSQTDLLHFINSKKKYITSIWKIHNNKNLCLYDYEFTDVDFMKNYENLPEMYYIYEINDLDIKIMNIDNK